MLYARIINGVIDTYPYTFEMLRKDNPTVSYPRNYDLTREADVVKVQPTVKPNYDLTKNITEGTPQEFDGVWMQMWTEVPASAEEVADRQASASMKSDKLTIKADTFVQNFISMTPAQVSDHVDNTVTDLASAKNLLNKLSLIVQLLARREFT